MVQKTNKDVFDSLIQGMNTYRHDHGYDAPADIVEQALHNAFTSQLSSLGC